MTSPTDVRELIPELYFLPEMFLNMNNFPFGTLQDGQAVSIFVLSIIVRQRGGGLNALIVTIWALCTSSMSSFPISLLPQYRLALYGAYIMSLPVNMSVEPLSLDL